MSIASANAERGFHRVGERPEPGAEDASTPVELVWSSISNEPAPASGLARRAIDRLDEPFSRMLCSSSLAPFMGMVPGPQAGRRP
jgi:hypothetical protein